MRCGAIYQEIIGRYRNLSLIAGIYIYYILNNKAVDIDNITSDIYFTGRRDGMNSLIKYTKRPRISPEFYNSPYTFSFKDLLAIFFTLGFFYACYKALTQSQALELVKTIAYLMAIILGGYFGHEITAAIIQEKYKTNTSAYSSNYIYEGQLTNNKQESGESGSEAHI